MTVSNLAATVCEIIRFFLSHGVKFLQLRPTVQ